MITMLTVRFRWLAQEVVNVYYVNHPGTDELSEVQDAATSITSAYSVLLDSLVSTIQMYTIDARRVDTPGWPTYTPIVVADENGTGAGDSVATQVAAIINFTSFTQRPRKSLKFIPGLPDTAIVNGQLTSAWVSTLASFATTLLANLNANTPPTPLVAVRWHESHSHVVASNPISTFAVNPIPGTQRRRKIGVGI